MGSEPPGPEVRSQGLFQTRARGASISSCYGKFFVKGSDTCTVDFPTISEAHGVRLPREAEWIILQQESQQLDIRRASMLPGVFME